MRGTGVAGREPRAASPRAGWEGTTSAPAREATRAGTARERPPAGRRRLRSTWRRTAAGLAAWSLRRCAEASVTGRQTAARSDSHSLRNRFIVITFHSFKVKEHNISMLIVDVII